MAPVTRELQIRLLKLFNYKVALEEENSTLERTFSDDFDSITHEEEEILAFSEIFQVLANEVPDVLINKFNQIIKYKKIPVRRTSQPSAENNTSSTQELKTFFVYSENKILMEICDSLSPTEVYKYINLLSVLLETYL